MVPGERQKVLFKWEMVNVSRILHKPEENKITVLGREILIYLDPQTGQRVDQWTNPWTNEQVIK